jgi:hypothetical protein
MNEYTKQNQTDLMSSLSKDETRRISLGIKSRKLTPSTEMNSFLFEYLFIIT